MMKTMLIFQKIHYGFFLEFIVKRKISVLNNSDLGHFPFLEKI
jgi:hypothetical protein